MHFAKHAAANALITGTSLDLASQFRTVLTLSQVGKVSSLLKLTFC